MRKTTLVVLVVVALLFGSAFAQKARYVIDPVHSTVGFAVSHMVISKVQGKFNEYDVVLWVDEKDFTNSSVEAHIKTASIDTDNPKRDGHLKSADFLDAEQYPEIVFRSERIEKTDDGYVAHGKLTIRGVTRDVALPFTVTGPIQDPWGNTRLGVEAHLTIDRFDYDVKWNKLLETGQLVVGREIDINIHAEFVKAKAEASTQ
ncbi:MAG: polyisoprenoid-binding protein [Calditrichaeota bacterium]|nr:MAG: polyisoprenoid-binding protein [Calditrichota bacterium]